MLARCLGSWGLGTLSGLSYPIGAVLGSVYSPVSDRVTSLVLAFGAGSLMFAVTVQMYAKTLQDLSEHGITNMDSWAAIFGGFAGTLFFLSVDKLLEGGVGGDEEVPEDGSFVGREVQALNALTPADALRSGSPAQRMRRRTASVSSAVSSPAWDHTSEQSVAHLKGVAYSLFAGVLIDGVPEGVFLGLLAAQGHLTLSLVFSLFIANFPEAFSAASLLSRAGSSLGAIVAMWSALCLTTGTLCGITTWVVLTLCPAYEHGGSLSPFGTLCVSAVQGLTGGAMMACICKVMIPDSYERSGGKGAPLWYSSGLWCTAGFLASMGLEVILGARQDASHFFFHRPKGIGPELAAEIFPFEVAHQHQAPYAHRPGPQHVGPWVYPKLVALAEGIYAGVHPKLASVFWREQGGFFLQLWT